MDKNYSADKPISNSIEDKFQRYPFAKRIATTIKERQSSDCIVIGLYGIWGEGKTSVLNFIDSELKQSEDVVTIKFNPWRFNDEVTLLNDFFKLLANSLNTSLQSNGERVSELLKKYSKLAAPLAKFIPLAGQTFSALLDNVSDALPTDTIEELKEKVNTILKENKKKIVVFIDDIDRLDKSEIHSIFKLVKLTADFYNTTYILSFDENMVAAAIGERFGEGNKEAGKSFLEKIIQVPLNLPVAQPAALQQFCFDIINNFFSSSNLELNDNDARSFSGQFQTNILIRLNTPRLAIRYGNTLSFSIPLLYGEVNMGDLLIIEAIKVFYPQHYNFIRVNPDFFIGSYNEPFGTSKDKKKIELINKHLEDLGSDLSTKQKGCIKNLFIDLFPRLNEIYNNHYYSNHTETKLYKDMRIGSPKHFSRFFTYSVIKGDLSDITFKNFMSEVLIQVPVDIADSIKRLVSESSPENFLIKLRSIEEDYEWDTAKKIATAIVTVTEIFPKNDGQFLMRFETPYGQSQIFIFQLIKKHKFNTETFDFVKQLFHNIKQIEYAFDFNEWFKTEKEEDKIFNDQLLHELDYELIKRAIKESDEVSIFEKYENKIGHLVNSWVKINHDEVLDYSKSFIVKNSKEIINILRTYTPTIWSSLFPKPYKSDFSEEYFKHFISIFDVNFLEKEILKVYSKEDINEEEVKWVGREKNTQTDLNIVRQFFYWKNNNLKSQNS